MTKDEMVLKQLEKLADKIDGLCEDVAVLKHISKNVDGMREDVAILKSQHKSGTMSEKVSASVAALALVVSVSIFGITSCRDQINEKTNNGRKPSVIGHFKK